MFFTSLPELLAAHGAAASAGVAVLSAPGALYRAASTDAVYVNSTLVVSGLTGEDGMSTRLDLTAFTDLAFIVQAGATLELRNLTLLLPPLPTKAATGSPASALAHVIGLDASGARVRLTGVNMVMATRRSLCVIYSWLLYTMVMATVHLTPHTLLTCTCSDLFTVTHTLCTPEDWRYGTTELQVLRGIVLYGNGTMPLGLASGGSGPPPDAASALAILVDTSITCMDGPPPPPWACSATYVASADMLRSTAEEMLAGTAGPVLLSLTGNVTLQPDSWGSGLVVREGQQLGLYGNPEPLRAVQLDFAGIAGAIVAESASVLLRQLVLLGLPYAPNVDSPKELFAVWVHAVFTGRDKLGMPTLGWSWQEQASLVCDQCTLVLSPLEAAMWCRAAKAPQPSTPLVYSWGILGLLQEMP
ncbi:hypothetical protein TSOC_005836 [Tetrabaena socialis]|uniref:Uncharacterized protein n=1 Tax=Tetrabaena socialis TaxID=47790 RepID=A0A2J8A572_9CHLO|nr:hypothetical protein TSOC_005836 [Tetrabaena socialis]|eukprot:PNH07669.1 hypothetical protein TSOC_005836 [Tetrabaena socialis]